jgi:hypothetical protein
MENAFGNESWLVKKWRPMMAWLYMVICAFDFILAPILMIAGDTGIQWQPLTLQSGGMVHIAFGAIIGISAWSRGQEKVTYLEHFEKVREEITPVKKEPIA